MYVPPDEGLQEVGEINMIFRPEEGLPTVPPGTRLPATIGSNHGIASATNPMFRAYVHLPPCVHLRVGRGGGGIRGLVLVWFGLGVFNL